MVWLQIFHYISVLLSINTFNNNFLTVNFCIIKSSLALFLQSTLIWIVDAKLFQAIFFYPDHIIKFTMKRINQTLEVTNSWKQLKYMWTKWSCSAYAQIFVDYFYLELHKVEKRLMLLFFARVSEMNWNCPIVQMFPVLFLLFFIFGIKTNLDTITGLATLIYYPMNNTSQIFTFAKCLSFTFRYKTILLPELPSVLSSNSETMFNTCS